LDMLTIQRSRNGAGRKPAASGDVVDGDGGFGAVLDHACLSSHN